MEGSVMTDTKAKLLCLSQKFDFRVIAVPDHTTGWNKIESFLDGQNVPVGDISTLPCPRLQSVGGELFSSLDGMQGVMKLTSLKYIDLFWADKEHKPYPEIIAEESPRYRYYGVLYMLQGIPEDKAAMQSLKNACEAAGAMFRTTTEKTLRVDRYAFAESIWKRFLADIAAQFNEVK
jgi:hypothetical protein